MRAILVVLVVACSQQIPAPPPVSNVAPVEVSPVTQTGPDEWTVTFARSRGRYSAVGVVVTSTKPTASEPVPHAGIAAARAWRKIAIEAKLVDPEVAARAALAGLEEVSKQCKDRPDDTRFRIDFGRFALEDGKFEHAAADLLLGLERRIRQCVKKHPTVDAEVPPAA